MLDVPAASFYAATILAATAICQNICEAILTSNIVLIVCES